MTKFNRTRAYSGENKHQEVLDIYLFKRRSLICILLVILCFFLLVLRSFFLQVSEHSKYTTLSNSNRIKMVPLPPTRGQIFDRNGVLLATNIPSFNLVITLQDTSMPIDSLIKEIQKTLLLTEYEITRYKRLNNTTPRQNPSLLKERLTEEEIARLSVNLYQFDGVDIIPQLTRIYPNGAEAVHALGYVGRIDEGDLLEIEKGGNKKEYLTLTHIGKRGSEKSFEHLLRGTMGFEKVETNSNGRIIRKIDQKLPAPGKDLYLTIDMRLQRVSEQILGDNTGVVVAIDPRNGEVLAFVSMPTYDPNLFVNGIGTEDFKALNEDPEHPFFNRVMQGNYPPGSTIKPQVALAGLEKGVITPNSTVRCNGYFQVPGAEHRFRDWRRWGHGNVDLYQSLVQSCDVYYYDLAYKMGITAMTDFLKQFSLGSPTGIDLLGESGGVSPTPEFKRARFKKPWYTGETVTAGIGQSYWQTTPLQVAQATAIIAVKGKAFKPHILLAERNPAEEYWQPVIPTAIKPIQLKNEQYWNSVIRGMIGVVHDPRGTGRRIASGISYKIAGKTGTAQVKSIAQNARYNKAALAKKFHDHAWFTAFAPADNPTIALAVLIENGGSGSGVAAPIAKEIIHSWISNFTNHPSTPILDQRAGE